MQDRTPLASGRDADVFAVDEHTVLRRYRDGGDVTAEAAVMAYVAAAGFPVPAVYDAHGPDLVLQRVDGVTMLQAFVAGGLGIEQAGGLLADLHHRLHRIPARTGTAAGHRVVHLDLHPENVMLGPAGPVVIDWRNATDGPPDLDLAMTAVIMAEVAVDESNPMAVPAADLLSAFLRYAGGDVPALLDEAVLIRRANPTLTAVEVDRLTAAAGAVLSARAAHPPTRRDG